MRPGKKKPRVESEPKLSLAEIDEKVRAEFEKLERLDEEARLPRDGVRGGEALIHQLGSFVSYRSNRTAEEQREFVRLVLASVRGAKEEDQPLADSEVQHHNPT